MDSIEVLETPEKSENDRKSYRVIRLANGLKALLISVPVENAAEIGKSSESDKLAACSLGVDVGSFSDPREIQGLAHFLEHMVFMGSEKYPHENDVLRFMQYCGGDANAITSDDQTTFYFSIREENLNEALDRFSQIFIAPLMLKEAMTREREAVDSEFTSKKNDDEIIRGQLLSFIGEPSHPSSKFSWGNLKTLKDNIENDVLYKEVHEFRKRHYSANRMCLCLQSKLSLDSLQELVIRHFSNVPSNNLPGDDFSQYTHENAFQSKFYEKVFFVKPIGNISRIDITWCLEPMLKKFKCMPDNFIGHILGHEGKGSLLSFLRKNLWAIELTVDSITSNKLFTLFNLSIQLTNEGFNHLDDVLETIFSYLKLLHVSGPNESIFKEVQALGANNFKFSNENNSLENVGKLISNLNLYPTKYILSGGSLFFEYDPDAIREIIDELNSRKFNIMITSTRRYNENVKFELTEPWSGTVYTEMDMPTKWISLWQNAKPYPEFALPEPNPFIADDFTILYKDGTIIPKYPTKILENDLCELWFRQDDKFLLPVACFNFHLMTPNAKSSTDNIILMSLMSTLLKHQLAEELYPAIAAGLEYKCYASNLGLIFKVEGFNQKLHLIVNVMSKCLKSLADNITENTFDVFLQQEFNTYENCFLTPKLLLKEISQTIIKLNHQPIYERNKRLRSIKFSDFQRFCRNFCQQMRIKALVQGNVTEDRALNVMSDILNELNCGRVEDLSSIEMRENKLPVGANYLRCKAFDPEDVNTLTVNLYQMDQYTTTYHTGALIHLLVYVARDPIYDILRTKEQLAYVVNIERFQAHGCLAYGISMNSQESKFTADYVEERIELFRQFLITIIEKMPDDIFKDIVMKFKLVDDNKLSEEVGRNWSEIENDEYKFDRLHRELSELSTITKNELLEFYRANFDDNERKLSVQIIGNSQANKSNTLNPEPVINEDLDTQRKRYDALTYVDFYEKPKGNLIHDLTEFKNSLDVYPVVRMDEKQT